MNIQNQIIIRRRFNATFHQIIKKSSELKPSSNSQITVDLFTDAKD